MTNIPVFPTKNNSYWARNGLIIIFLGFSEVLNIKSGETVSTIRNVLLHTQISSEKCRGQCYESDNNRLSKKSGVAEQILDIHPNASVNHCHYHFSVRL